MTHIDDMDFVSQLRGMAASTPPLALPDTAAIVRAGRSRVARRRSIYSGAFGLALLAGAGVATMPHVGLVGNHEVPVAAISHAESVTPMDLRATALGSPAPTAEVPDAIVPDAIVPDDASVIEAAAAATNRALTPLAMGLGIAGTAALGTAAGLAIRSKRMEPVPARRNGPQAEANNDVGRPNKPN